ncbi:MAG TPA: glucoamylase family protein, partial [Casimicrobiaceae bacterium]
SLPFAPEIVLPAIDHMVHDLDLKLGNAYGFKATFNPTYPEKSGNPNGWVSPWHYGLNQGPICSMIENYRSDLIWRLMRGCPYIVKGLQRAGFQGGWL